MKRIKILFVGGGTGGHIIPIIAIVREIRKISSSKNIQFFFIGPKDEKNNFGLFLLSQEGIKVKTVFAGKIRRYISPIAFVQNFIDIFIKVPIGILQSFFHIFFLSPDVIFSKGGFGSVPGIIAGKLLFTPIFMHESDIVPGFANKISRGFALEIFASFPKTECFSSKKLLVVGNPIRQELLNGSRAEGKKFFQINSRRQVILVLGGSQGAKRINDKILEILPQTLKSFELIHQCGENNYKAVKAEAKTMMDKNMEPFYHLSPFLKEVELRHAYAAADLIISRAGSGSIFEIAAMGKPSILIPLPEAAQNHQVRNAYAYEASGAAIVIEENNFTAHFFLERIRFIFDSIEETKKMSESAKEFSRPDAGCVIANYLIDYLIR